MNLEALWFRNRLGRIGRQSGMCRIESCYGAVLAADQGPKKRRTRKRTLETIVIRVLSNHIVPSYTLPRSRSCRSSPFCPQSLRSIVSTQRTIVSYLLQRAFRVNYGRRKRCGLVVLLTARQMLCQLGTIGWLLRDRTDVHCPRAKTCAKFCRLEHGFKRVNW